jgi:hypothetical protein
VARALGKARLDRAYLTHYSVLCGPDAISAAVRQVSAGLSGFEGLATQAHCLHLEGEMLITHLATEITKLVDQRLRSEGVQTEGEGEGETGVEAMQGGGQLGVEVVLAAEGLAQLVERWRASGV